MTFKKVFEPKPRKRIAPTAESFIDTEPSMMQRLIAGVADRLSSLEETEDIITDVVPEWMETNYMVYRPRDPLSGKPLQPGLIRLAEYQKRVLCEALRRDGDGKLKYSTVVWSEPKKSGKTEVAAAVAMYFAYRHPSAAIYCLANDGKQSQDRLFKAVGKCVALHKQKGGVFQDASIAWSPPILKLKNGTTLEAIPCDPSGEAGSEPLATFWCFDDQTEVMTMGGWKDCNTIGYEDMFATLNMETGKFEWQEGIVNKQHYKGQMYFAEYESRGEIKSSICVTPNHRIYGRCDGVWAIMSVEEAVECDKVIFNNGYNGDFGRLPAELRGNYPGINPYVRYDQWRLVDYDGIVWCPSTSNGIIYVRRHGIQYWMGNSELWGYKQQAKSRLWTELTIPPTLSGYAIRWVESYAGFIGESPVLEQLYDVGVNQSVRHPGFPDLPVYVNERAGQLTFWSEQPRQPWQDEAYYAREAATLHPLEFLRIHRNQWVSSSTSLFDDISWWDACADPAVSYLDPNDKTTPLVVALDASVSRDCCALVAVSRHPDDPWDTPRRRIIQQHVRVWYPKQGEQMDYSKTIEPAIEEVAERHHVVKFVFDPYQLHNTATNMRNKGVGSFGEFYQMTRRAIADKQFYDMIVHRLYIHDGNAESRKHALNAAAQVEGGKYLRIVKKADNRPVDLMVTASMAVDECLRLNL